MMSAVLSDKRKTKLDDFRNIFIWSLKKHKALGIVYASLLLFSSPVIGLLSSLSVGTLDNPVTVFTFASLSTVVTMIMTFIISVMMFDYLHNKRQADVFGSLPCTRRTLFFSRFTTGLAMIVVPYIINTLIVVLITLGLNAGSDIFTIYIPYIFQVGTLVLLSVIASYFFTAFMAVCCGTTANTVLSTLLICFAYPIAISMLSILGSSMIPGVNLHIDKIPLISNLLSPYGSSAGGILSLTLSIIKMDSNAVDFLGDNWQQIIAWAILIAASFIGCFFLTKKRKTEAAQNSFAFKAPSVIIRAIATAAVGLLFGLIFTFAICFNNNPEFGNTAQASQINPWTMFTIFIIAFVIAAFLTHLVATVIFNKGFKGFAKSLISFVSVVLCVCLLYTSLAFGGFGADKYLPQTDEISSVEISSSDSPMLGMSGSLIDKLLGTSIYSAYYSHDKSILCYGEESINAAIELHKRIINNLNTMSPTPYYISTFGQPNSYNTQSNEASTDDLYYDIEDSIASNPSSLKFVYHMKNGSTVERSYSDGYYSNIYMTSSLEDIESIASKENSSKLMSLLSNDGIEVTSFNIMSAQYISYNSVINLKNIVSNIKNALIDDINSGTKNEDYDSYDEVFCKLIVSYREKNSSKNLQMNITVPTSYKNSVKLLSQYGYTTGLNLIYDADTLDIGVSQFYLDDSGMLSKEAAEQFFTLPDNISTDYLEGRTTKLSDDTSTYSANSFSAICYDMYYNYGYYLYDYEDSDYSTESKGEQIIEENKLSFRVVYTDKDGNLYYYKDKCLYADLYDSSRDAIVLHHLQDNNDKNKKYYPFVIQAFSSEERITTTPINISLSSDESRYYVNVNSKTNIKQDSYIFLVAV